MEQSLHNTHYIRQIKDCFWKTYCESQVSENLGSEN